MKTFKKSLQFFTAISLFALACANLNAAVTITQDDLSGDQSPDFTVWQTKFTDNGYKTIAKLSDNWACTSVRMRYDRTYLTSESNLRCQSEMPMGSVWLIARIDANSDVYYQTLKVELGKRSGRFWIWGNQIFNTFPQYTNIMSTAEYTANIYHDENNRYQLIRFDLNLPENFALRITAPDSDTTSELEIKQIVIGPPVAELNITKNDLEYHPGYPSVLDPTEFSITTTPIYTNSHVLASNLSPKIYWRENGGAWQNKELKRRGRFGYNYTNSLVNLPAGKELHVLPSAASLTYRIPFDRKISDNDLQLFVDYQDFILSSNKQVLVQLRDLSSAIISFDIYPKVVECILID